MNELRYVEFRKADHVKLPTHQSPIGALSIWRDSERTVPPSDTDEPCWRIRLDHFAGEAFVVLGLVKDSVLYRRVGGNAERDEERWVPLSNVSYVIPLGAPRPIDTPADRMARARAAKALKASAEGQNSA